MNSNSSLALRALAVVLSIAVTIACYAFIPFRASADPLPTVDDSYSTAEDAVLHVSAPGVLANDLSGLAIDFSSANAPAHGAVTLNVDGSFDYTPAPDYNGPDSFSYAAGDGLATTSANVNITVTPVNDPVTATSQALSTPFNTAITSAFAFADIDTGDAHTFATSSNPAHGTLSLDGAGNFTYTPESGYSGTDSFTWNVGDGGATSSDATAAITVLPAPVAVAPQLGISIVVINDSFGTSTPADFSIFIDSATTSGATTTYGVGGHTITGSDRAHYERTFKGDCAADGTVVLASGDVKSCTIVYDDVYDGGGAIGVPALGIMGHVLGASTTAETSSTTLPELPPGCTPLLTGFMRKSGFNNDPDQVIKLQQFLNANINAALPLTGDFGPATDAAVRNFQQLHADQILVPWGIEKATGFVYLTTQRWINIMSCTTLDIPMPKLVPYVAR